MTPQLLPCPFCGSTNIRVYKFLGYFDDFTFSVGCLADGCFCELGAANDHGDPYGEFTSEQAAITAWNTRAPNNHDALVKALREMVGATFGACGPDFDEILSPPCMRASDLLSAITAGTKCPKCGREIRLCSSEWRHVDESGEPIYVESCKDGIEP